GPWPARARLAVRCMGALRAKRRRYPSALRSQVRSFWPRHAHADPPLRRRRDPLGSGGGDPGLDTDFGAAGECRRDLPPAPSLAGFGEAEPDARYAARTAAVILARLCLTASSPSCRWSRRVCPLSTTIMTLSKKRGDWSRPDSVEDRPSSITIRSNARPVSAITPRTLRSFCGWYPPSR